MADTSISIYDWQTLSIDHGVLTCITTSGDSVQLASISSYEKHIDEYANNTVFAFEGQSYLLSKGDSTLTGFHMGTATRQSLQRAELLELFNDRGGNLLRATDFIVYPLPFKHSNGRPIFVAKLGKTKPHVAHRFEYTEKQSEYAYHLYRGGRGFSQLVSQIPGYGSSQMTLP